MKRPLKAFDNIHPVAQWAVIVVLFCLVAWMLCGLFIFIEIFIW